MSAITAEEVVVDLLARTDKMERQLASASRTVDQRLSGIEARGSAFASRFTGLLAGVSVAALAQEFLKLADASKTMDAQLKLATAGFGSFTQGQADVRRLASDTRQSLEATTKLYGGFARAAKETGRSQEDAARATQTFAEALKIGGAGTAEAESATLQFNQALQSGTLRGDEFNSIMEASPRVARLLADGLGVPIGQLRAMAEQGKITSDVLFKSLTDQRFTAGIDDEFRELPVTFADAMQQVENAATITFGAFDSGGEFSKAIATFVTSGATGFEDLESAAESFGVEVRAVLDGLGDAFDPLVSGAEAAFNLIGGKVFTLREQISSVLGSFDRVANIAAAPGRFAQNTANDIRGFFGYKPNGTVPLSDARGAFERGYNGSVNAESQRARGKAADEFLDEVLSEFDTPSRPARPVAAAKKTRAKAAPKSPLDPEAFAREEAQLNDQLLRAKADEATTAEDVAALELQRIDAAKARYNAETDANKKLTGPQKAQLIAANELVTATERAVAIRKRDVAIEQRAADTIRRGYDTADAQLKNQIDEERSKGDLAKTAKDRRASELRILELTQAQERAEQEHLITLNQRVLADKKAAPDARAEAEAQIARAQGRLDTLSRTQPNERKAVEEKNAGPLQAYGQQLHKNTDDMNEALQGVAVNGLKSVEDGLVGIISGTESVADAFKQMATQIIADLARIAIEKAIVSLLGDAFGGGFADGGLVQVPGFATGGFISGPGGPRSDSMLARVSNGEFVVNADATKRFRPALEAMNGGAGMAAAKGIDTNARAAAQGGNTIVQQTFVLDARNGITTPQLLEYVNETARREATQAGVASYKQSMRDVPGRLAKFQRLGT